MRNSFECHVISLARAPNKYHDFLARNRTTGLPFKLFCAVDGSELTREDCLEQGLITANAIAYSRGAVGVAASHLMLWKEAERTKSNLLIFEDDVFCRRDLAIQIDMLLAKLTDWDIVLLGFNTDAILDVKLAEHFSFDGFCRNEAPSRDELEAFGKETGDVVALRLNHAFGLCSYLVSPRGARRLISLFPMDNRRVFIPGNMAKFGKNTFSCMTLDMICNTLYPRINAFVTLPPLALPLNDQSTSTTWNEPSSDDNERP